MLHNTFLKVASLTVTLFLLVGCSSGGGSSTSGKSGNGNSSTVVLASVVAPGAQCPNGGIQVDSGIDENGNGVLDASEIDESQIVCNGNDSLISMSDEPTGANCEYGGTRIDTGTDTNGNDFLDSIEITATEYLCALVTTAFDGLVYLADANLAGMTELFRTTADAPSVAKLGRVRPGSGDVRSFRISPDRTKVAIHGNLETDQVFELYVADLLSGQPAVKVSGTLVAGGNVSSDYAWAPDSSRIAYRADQETDRIDELYTVAPDGTANLKVSGALIAEGDVWGYAWAPDSSRIAYRADQETDEVAPWRRTEPPISRSPGR